MSAGALSMYRLWDDLSINVAIRKYINMFGLRITLYYYIYMIVEATLAIISSIELTILIKRSFCDDNSISYEVMVSLNRFLTNRCV